MAQVITVALIIIAIFVLIYMGPMADAKKEHADLSAPSFDDSLVDKYRSYIKDNRGMTLNDYALESAIVKSTPLSGNYRIL